ncbi:GntR family transcriptional regulator [Jiella mangrovi]|uniref:GntR family transcriptional regulator n=1 Tax=Jiella mangrovi TaxID=2821407 RepID=A0ABS4BGB6_9HYPH|nr:GntR family transcriptional regulator [Jiella mangrovi]MBP0615792.1 GntR family transcriptional regulator [Jiella mangrovi]
MASDLLRSSLLKPVGSRKTVQDQVYDQLRDALMSGAFEARATFTIASLADRFQTSHMPVREALRRLASESALRIATQGTAFVPDITLAELADITRARVIIEGATAEIAAARMGQADIAELERILAIHVATGTTGDITAMVAANRGFHFYIYDRAGSPVLMSQIENLWLRSGPYVRFLSDKMAALLKSEYKEGFVLHHAEMLDALRAGDPLAFRQAMEADIKETEHLLRDFLSSPGAIDA